MPVEVFIQKMTDHMESGRIIRWLVKEGEEVKQHQPIMELETDKAVAELESPASGILKGIRPGAVEGAQVPVGESLAFIVQSGEEAPILRPLPIKSPQSVSQLAVTRTEIEDTRTESMRQVRAVPAVRRIARELGIDLALLTGSGPDGKIREEDVRAFAAASAQKNMVAVTSASAEWAELAAAQRITGQRMLQSIQTVPQFALSVSADMTNALQFREALMKDNACGQRPSITVLLVKIVAGRLKHHPRANASFQDGRIKLHREVNVGVAIGTEGGLVVPVIKEADQKSLVQIARELQTFREKANQMRFSPDDLSDGTFTISNLGMYGVDQFNAIVNPPQSAILAVGRIIKVPMALRDTVTVLPVMNLTLSIDHRVLDGVQAAKFLSEVKECLQRSDLLREE